MDTNELATNESVREIIKNPFYSKVNKAVLTTEEYQEWEKVCKERNYNPDFAYFYLYEFIYDTLVRLKDIEDKLNRQ